MNEASTERRSGVDRRRLSGAQKAAALLIVMGKDAASRLIQGFDPDELKQVTRAAATLGVVDRASLETLIAEFEHELGEGPELVGDLKEAELLVSGALTPAEVASMMDEVGGGGGTKTDVWAVLKGASDATVTRIVANETPQVGAFVLSQLESETAARVSAQLEPALRNDVLARMLELRPVGAQMRTLIEDALRLALDAPEAASRDDANPARLAGILNRMDAGAVDEVLSNVEIASPADAQAVRARMFRFEDTPQLSQRARTAVFDGVAAERVVLALQGADADLRDAVLGALSARSRRLVESELAVEQQPAERDVNAARRAIADLALQLADTGAIELPGAAAPDAVAG